MLHVRSAESIEPEAPKTAAHDDGPSDALVAFMTSHWEPRTATTAPHPEIARFRARREALSRAFPGDALVVETGREKVRANDTAYRFRPGTDFYYLTGNVEPDCVLVMTPEGDGHRARLYVEPNLGKSDKTFFTDRTKGELWVGARLGVCESSERFGLQARGLPELSSDLGALLPSLRVRTVRDGDGDPDLASVLSEMRLIKDAYEIGELERAIASTHRGFDDVLRALPRSKTERYVEGIFNLRARVEGNDVGYNTIAAAGRHACTLHWTANDGPVKPGELLLLDAGVEATSLYTADVTRTVPIDGTFTPEQREIYDLVYAAQAAAFERCAPGNDFMAPHKAAMEVIAHGLERLGILPMPAHEALREENHFYKRYSLHGTSHMLGIDVHDCARARAENYKHGALRAGMVLTVEPGLYFQIDDATVPERYRGIGVRIEDDVVITPSGYRNLSAAIPSEPEAVQAWVRASSAAG